LPVRRSSTRLCLMFDLTVRPCGRTIEELIGGISGWYYEKKERKEIRI